MSFVITVHIPEAIVMASDSRQSVNIEERAQPEKDVSRIETILSDFVFKTFHLSYQQVGISAFGESLLGKVTTESHIKRFSEEDLDETDDVLNVPRKLLDYFQKRFPNADTAFHVSGFRKEGRSSVPYVFHCQVSRNEMIRVNLNPDKQEIIFGSSWGGQGDIMASLLQPVQILLPNGQMEKVQRPPILWDAMSIQDAIDFSIHAVRTTIETMRFQARPKNVGGAIDVLLLTPDGSKWIQRKNLHGERQS
ncbi:MAG TPA: hypothetical protein VGB26_07365 [Nitrospiria bacterium]|jgi:hypothetical protein